jgi:hypothetical protein
MGLLDASTASSIGFLTVEHLCNGRVALRLFDGLAHANEVFFAYPLPLTNGRASRTALIPKPGTPAPTAVLWITERGVCPRRGTV